MTDFTMYGSLFLIGAALALSGAVGLFLPQGYRPDVVLALLAGAGVGIACLALGSALASRSPDDWWRVFFVSSIAGFAIVVSGLVVAWKRRDRSGSIPSSL